MRTVKAIRSVAAAVFAGAVVFAPYRAEATTVCGTIITNMVSATMHSGPPDFVVYPTPDLQGSGMAPTFTAVVQVACPPAIQMEKFVNWPTASAGTTVVFRICVVNETTDSVWGVTITDKFPSGMIARGTPPITWSGENTYGSFQTPPDVGQPVGPAFAWAKTEIPNMTGTPAAFNGQVPGLYLRWTIEFVGPMRSACVAFQAEIL